MSLIIRRNATPDNRGKMRNGIDIDSGRVIIRVAQVDPDGTVHLAILADRSIPVHREEMSDQAKHQFDAGDREVQTISSHGPKRHW